MKVILTEYTTYYNDGVFPYVTRNKINIGSLNNNIAPYYRILMTSSTSTISQFSEVFS